MSTFEIESTLDLAHTPLLLPSLGEKWWVKRHHCQGGKSDEWFLEDPDPDVSDDDKRAEKGYEVIGEDEQLFTDGTDDIVDVQGEMIAQRRQDEEPVVTFALSNKGDRLHKKNLSTHYGETLREYGLHITRPRATVFDNVFERPSKINNSMLIVESDGPFPTLTLRRSGALDRTLAVPEKFSVEKILWYKTEGLAVVIGFTRVAASRWIFPSAVLCYDVFNDFAEVGRIVCRSPDGVRCRAWSMLFLNPERQLVMANVSDIENEHQSRHIDVFVTPPLSTPRAGGEGDADGGTSGSSDNAGPPRGTAAPEAAGSPGCLSEIHVALSQPVASRQVRVSHL